MTEAGALTDLTWVREIKEHLPLLIAASFVLVIAYFAYSFGLEHDGAYSEVVKNHFARSGDWQSGLWLIFSEAPLIAPRTYLFTALSVFLNLTWLGLAYTFFERTHKGLERWAPCTMGIFVFHFPFICWMQYWFVGSSMPLLFKSLTVFFVSAFMAWLITYNLRRVPFFRRVL